jgi:Tfp pilus assembly protein PilF
MVGARMKLATAAVTIAGCLALLSVSVPPAQAQGSQEQAYGYYMQGIKAENAGDLPGAVEAFRHSIASNPRIKEVHHELAKALARTGQNEQAYAEFMTAINLDAKFVEARNNFGQFLVKTDKDKQAQLQFESCIRVDPKYPYAYYNLAKLLKRKGDLNGAIDNFQTTVNLVPTFGEAQEALGMAIYERAAQGDLSTAVEKLEAAAKLVPKNPRIHYHLGIIYATKSKLDAAETEYRIALMNESQMAAAHWELGKLRYYRGDLDRALAEIKQALAVSPTYTAQQGYPEPMLTKVKMLEEKTYEHMGDLPNELRTLAELAAMRRNDDIYDKKIKDLQKEIRHLAQENKKKPLPYDPQEVDAFIAKGIDQYEDGDLDAAKMSFQHALDMNPKSFRAMQNICFIQEAQGDLTSALTTAQKALALNPDYDGAVYNLAYLLEKSNLPDDAGRMYLKYRSMADSYPWDPQHIAELQQNIIREQKKQQDIRKRGF